MGKEDWSFETLRKEAVEAIKDSVPAGTEEKNIKAFEAGYNLV